MGTGRRYEEGKKNTISYCIYITTRVQNSHVELKMSTNKDT